MSTGEKENPIEHSAVQGSSNVASYGYDPGRRILEVAFHNGGTYRYLDVAPDVYHGLSLAQSVGSYLHHHVKPHHTVQQVGAPGIAGEE